MENGDKFKYDAPVSSQNNVNKLSAQIHKLSEQAQLSVMRQEIKFKKVVFSELPNKFILFKQLNISAKQMYQNLLSVDASHQEVFSMEDIYTITNSMDSLSMRKQGKGKGQKDNTDSQDQSSTMSDLQWPLQEEDFVINAAGRRMEPGICSIL